MITNQAVSTLKEETKTMDKFFKDIDKKIVMRKYLMMSFTEKEKYHKQIELDENIDIEIFEMIDKTHFEIKRLRQNYIEEGYCPDCQTTFSVDQEDLANDAGTKDIYFCKNC